jgi:ATP-dependent DNA helicase PIF1
MSEASDFNNFSRAILTPKNANVDYINNIAIDMMEASPDVISLKSVDSIVPEHYDTAQPFNPVSIYPEEFLNTISLSGMPPHDLKIKLGAPCILLRTMDQSRGLCNGTRIIPIKVTPRLLTVKIISGSHVGLEVVLPRIDLKTDKSAFPFIMVRRQFPIKPAFAMTINKSQGQSIAVTGIYLPEPVFTHGQLYVGASRSGDPLMTKFLMVQKANVQGKFSNLQGALTKNVVYHEVLTNDRNNN